MRLVTRLVPRYTIYLEDNQKSVLTDCTDVQVTSDGVSFVNRDGAPCVTNIRYFIKQEPNNEKPL